MSEWIAGEGGVNTMLYGGVGILWFLFAFNGPTWWNSYYLSRKAIPTIVSLIAATLFSFKDPSSIAAGISQYAAMLSVGYFITHLLMFAYGKLLERKGLQKAEIWTYWLVPLAPLAGVYQLRDMFISLPYSLGLMPWFFIVAGVVAIGVRLRDVKLGKMTEWQRQDLKVKKALRAARQKTKDKSTPAAAPVPSEHMFDPSVLRLE